MADNTQLNPGTGGDTIATDDIGGVKHQQVKVEWGVDGTATPTSAANPLPVVQTGTPGLPSGAATSAKQDTGNTSVANVDTTLGAKTDAKDTATDATSVSGISVLKQISASVQAPPSQAVTNSGTFAVQAAQSGTWSVGSSSATGSAIPANAFFMGVRASSGNLGGLQTANDTLNSSLSGGEAITVANAAQFDDVAPTAITENRFGNLRMSSRRELYGQIRDAAGNERGANVTAGGALVTDASATTQPVSGTFWQATQPVSGTFWQATQPVSGTVTANAGTGTMATAEVAPTTVLNGKKTVTTAGTRVTLAGSTTAKSVTIKALAANTGIIYVGDSSVASTTGFQLAAGDTISLDIANLNTVNLDSSVNGEGVSYLGVN